MPGRLITFEGIDGSGKTTQIARLAKRLQDMGVRCVVTCEPGGVPRMASLRDLLLGEDLDPLAELLLYMADRAEHVRRVIRPSLKEGLVVLSDRYADATVAYQGYGRGLDLGLIAELNRIATDGVLPDLTILLDCPVEAALKRKAANRRRAEVPMRPPGGDRFERTEILECVRRGYLEIARREPERVRVVDSSGPLEETERRVWEIVRSALWPSGI